MHNHTAERRRNGYMQNRCSRALKYMALGHEQNYFTSSEHKIFEPTIKQFGNLRGPTRFAINSWNLLRNRLLCMALTSLKRQRQHLICASRCNSINSIVLLAVFAGH